MVPAERAAEPQGNVPRPGGLGEILQFTALRGVAAWWVVGYHFREYLPLGSALRPVLAEGALAVDLFFIMSGFVMALSYGHGFAGGVTWHGYLRFLALRLGRIYPVHLLVLLLFVSVPIALSATGRPLLDDQFLPGYFVQSLFLTQTWGFGQGLAWNLPAWSISTEMMFYLLCPFVLTAAGRGLSGLAAPAAAMGVVLVLIGFVGAAAGGLTLGIDQFGVFRCILECTLGVLLFRASRLAGRPAWLCVGLLLVTAVCGWAVVTLRAPDYALIPLGFTCLLWSLLFPRNWLGVVLSNPALLWLGRLSYATYMVHFLVKYWVKFLLVDQMPPPVLCAAYAGCVLLASVAVHYLVELPARRLARGLVRHWFEADRAPRPGWTKASVGGGVQD